MFGGRNFSRFPDHIPRRKKKTSYKGNTPSSWSWDTLVGIATDQQVLAECPWTLSARVLGSMETRHENESQSGLALGDIWLREGKMEVWERQHGEETIKMAISLYLGSSQCFGKWVWGLFEWVGGISFTKCFTGSKESKMLSSEVCL